MEPHGCARAGAGHGTLADRTRFEPIRGARRPLLGALVLGAGEPLTWTGPPTRQPMAARRYPAVRHREEKGGKDPNRAAAGTDRLTRTLTTTTGGRLGRPGNGCEACVGVKTQWRGKNTQSHTRLGGWPSRAATHKMPCEG